MIAVLQDPALVDFLFNLQVLVFHHIDRDRVGIILLRRLVDRHGIRIVPVRFLLCEGKHTAQQDQRQKKCDQSLHSEHLE